MRATSCKYILDFNPAYDKARTQWDRARAKILQQNLKNRAAAVGKIDEEFEAVVEPIVQKDIDAGIVRCKADMEVPLNDNLSLDQIAETFGITRPRVQQIEVRAKEKILRERKAFTDFLAVIQSQPQT